MKVSRETYSKSGPVLKPADLEGADHAILTCVDVEERTFEGDQKRLQLKFEEFPEHVYFLNMNSLDALLAALGDNSDRWKGKKIPLHVVPTEDARTGKPMKSLWIVPADEWDEHVSRRGRPSSSARKSLRPRGKKKTRKSGR